MHEFDDAVLMCFLKKQSQLFPEEDVASNLEEAEAFLEECMAVVVESAEEVKEYFEEEGIDMDGADSVSYTHLDVYKRQTGGRGRWIWICCFTMIV